MKQRPGLEKQAFSSGEWAGNKGSQKHMVIERWMIDVTENIRVREDEKRYLV